jgi:hypothetical protein
MSEDNPEANRLEKVQKDLDRDIAYLKEENQYIKDERVRNLIDGIIADKEEKRKNLLPKNSSPVSHEDVDEILLSIVKKTPSGYLDVNITVEDYEKFPWKDGEYVPSADYPQYQEDLVEESVVPGDFACTILTPLDDSYTPNIANKTFRIFRNKNTITGDKKLEYVLNLEILWDTFEDEDRAKLVLLEDGPNPGARWRDDVNSSPVRGAQAAQPQNNKVGGVDLSRVRITFKVIF